MRRCVCSGISFEAILESGATSIDEAREILGVCDGCRTCEPYVKMVFETGAVAFAVIHHDT